MTDDQGCETTTARAWCLVLGHSLVIGHWSLVILNRFPARHAEKEKRQARACLSIELNGQRVAYSGWAEMWPGLG